MQYYIVSRAKPIQYQCGFIPPSQVSHSHFITLQYQLKCNRCGNIFESKINWRFILLSCIPKCDQCGNISPSTKLDFALPHFQNKPTTKSAFALPDLSKFDGVEFIGCLTYDKIGLCPSWFVKIWRSRFYDSCLTYDKIGLCPSWFVKICQNLTE